MNEQQKLYIVTTDLNPGDWSNWPIFGNNMHWLQEVKSKNDSVNRGIYSDVVCGVKKVSKQGFQEVKDCY